MPGSFQGFGTGFVGKRDFWPDGSYLTTEWVIVFFVPLAPLRSLRIKPRRRRVTFVYVAGSEERDYAIYDEGPPRPIQVACVYAFLVFYLAWVLGIFVVLSQFGISLDGPLGVALMLVGFGSPLLIPWCVRERSKRWRPGLR